MKETVEHNNRFYGEELKTESEQLKEWLIVANKESERLNNIIDKLKIDIENGALKYTYDTDYNRGFSDAFIYMNDRIKELKGSEKE